MSRTQDLGRGRRSHARHPRDAGHPRAGHRRDAGHPGAGHTPDAGHPRAGHRPDAGHTLVEMIVAMSLFSFVLIVVTGAVLTLSQSTRKTQNLSVATDAARAAFSRFDKQVRYASAINRPTLVGSDWYVEYQTVNGQNSPICVQWRVVNASHQLEQRTWSADTTPTTAPSWVRVAGSIINDAATQPPFSFTAAGPTTPFQMLTVTLVVSRGSTTAGTVRLSTAFAARNTDVNTATNTANASGASATQVCQQGVSRP